MPSANKTDSTLIKRKFIMFSHFFLDKENANMHFVALTLSLQNIRALGANAAQFYSEHKSNRKNGTIES